MSTKVEKSQLAKASMAGFSYKKLTDDIGTTHELQLLLQQAKERQLAMKKLKQESAGDKKLEMEKLKQQAMYMYNEITPKEAAKNAAYTRNELIKAANLGRALKLMFLRGARKAGRGYGAVARSPMVAKAVRPINPVGRQARKAQTFFQRMENPHVRQAMGANIGNFARQSMQDPRVVASLAGGATGLGYLSGYSSGASSVDPQIQELQEQLQNARRPLFGFKNSSANTMNKTSAAKSALSLGMGSAIASNAAKLAPKLKPGITPNQAYKNMWNATK